MLRLPLLLPVVATARRPLGRAVAAVVAAAAAAAVAVAVAAALAFAAAACTTSSAVFDSAQVFVCAWVGGRLLCVPT